ncbi:MAG TPA: ABC transporter ATP-binding protein [Candidatus Deferrimicrobiaceae bacterium]|jgi:lipoprotein-releasing system ATP-binding protein
MNSDTLIHVESLRKTYLRNGGKLEILKGITMDIARGELLGVVGVSGAGKTTLLQIVGTLDRPTSGSVSFEGNDISALSEEALASFRNRTIGFVFQFHHLLPEFDATENVMLPCLIQGASRSEARSRADALLDEVGLTDRKDHRIGELSGGEQQRVAICRALVMNPSVLLADEPTGNLDKETANGVFDLLRDLNRTRKLTVMMVTHNMDLASRMHRVIRIDDGMIA